MNNTDRLVVRLALSGILALLSACQAGVRSDQSTSHTDDVISGAALTQSTLDSARASDSGTPTTTPTPTGSNSNSKYEQTPIKPLAEQSIEQISEQSPEQSPEQSLEQAYEATPESNLSSPEPGTGEAVFARLRERLSPNACEAGGGAPRWRERYARDPSAFARYLEKTLPLLDFVSAEVDRQELPAEFALIPIVESWYQPEAIGQGGPAGMWQMISSTARNHGIRITPGYDGRLSPIESTRAALSYLDTLYPMFGDWRATVMAYNAGEYRLLSAFKRDGSREVSTENRKPSGLSNITYDYVAKLQALSCLITEPERQDLVLPLSARFTPLAAVYVDEAVRNLDQIAIDAGVSSAELQKLNPGYKSGRIVSGVPRWVLMPETSLASFFAERSRSAPTTEPNDTPHYPESSSK